MLAVTEPEACLAYLQRYDVRMVLLQLFAERLPVIEAIEAQPNWRVALDTGPRLLLVRSDLLPAPASAAFP